MNLRRSIKSLAVILISLALVETVSSFNTPKEILHDSKIQGGLIVHVGCGDGKSLAALGNNPGYYIHGLEKSLAMVQKARTYIRNKKLYGKITVSQWNGETLPYTDNLVDLLIYEDEKSISEKEIIRVLTPNGTAYIINKSKWKKIQKPWAKEIDEWTHHTHGPDGNSVAQDTVVGPPERYQWIQDPKWMRAHDTDASINALVTARGRIFYMEDLAPISLPGNNDLPDKWYLTARNAFNGILLWRIRVEQWGWKQWKDTWYKARPDNFPININRRVVSVGDYVYATLGFMSPVSQIDAATGKIIQTYKNTAGTREILVHNNQLILTVPDKKTIKILVLDTKTGKTKWESSSEYKGTIIERIRMKIKIDSVLNVAVDDEVVCFMDKDKIKCLDRNTGKSIWEKAIKPGVRKTGKKKARSLPAGVWAGTLIVHDEVVVYAEPSRLFVLSKKDGHTFWSSTIEAYQGLWFSWKDMFIIDDILWTWSGKILRNPEFISAYELKTGKEVKKFSVGNIYKVDHHHRCYRNKATSKYIISSRRGSEFVDLVEGKHSIHNWLRGICHYGMMLANGLQYVPPHPCKCFRNEQLNGFVAVAAGSVSGTESKSPRLIKGPSFGKIKEIKSQPKDWPVYRSDSERSCSTKSPIPAKVKKGWEVQLEGKLSTPIAVKDRIYLSVVDDHTVLALDKKSGKVVWERTVDGRVDSPPSYYKGMLLLGTRNGYVYCLSAVDGAISWRFRAASQERFIGAFDQIESAWPVHGSILIKGGVAYFAAGRSSYLDGGIHLFGLNPATGKIVHHKIVQGPEIDLNDENWHEEYKPSGGVGCKANILQTGNDVIYMRNRSFNDKLEGLKIDEPRIQTFGGFLDDSYFQRGFWFYEKNLPAEIEWDVKDHAYGLSQILVHDDKTFYRLRMFEKMKLLNDWNFFTPGAKGYKLYATDKKSRKDKWEVTAPIRAKVMVIGPKKLVIAGAPDIVDKDDPLGAFEGRKGAILWILDAGTGEKLSEFKLDSPPIFNGIAVQDGTVIITQKNGKVISLINP